MMVSMDSTVDWPRLRAAATEVMLQAYAKYSDFPVGAAVLTAEGRVIPLAPPGAVQATGKREVLLQYKDGAQRIVVPADAQIVRVSMEELEIGGRKSVFEDVPAAPM